MNYTRKNIITILKAFDKCKSVQLITEAMDLALDVDNMDAHDRLPGIIKITTHEKALHELGHADIKVLYTGKQMTSKKEENLKHSLEHGLMVDQKFHKKDVAEYYPTAVDWRVFFDYYRLKVSESTFVNLHKGAIHVRKNDEDLCDKSVMSTTCEINLPSWMALQRYRCKLLFRAYTKHGDSDLQTFIDTLPYRTFFSLRQFRLLDDLGFDWDFEDSSKQESLWDKSFKELTEYQIRNGHCYIPSFHINTKLRNWTMRMRQLRDSDELTDEKIKKLESINFIWNIDLDKIFTTFPRPVYEKDIPIDSITIRASSRNIKQALSSEAYTALRASIQVYGLKEPVRVIRKISVSDQFNGLEVRKALRADPDGLNNLYLLDGELRLHICRELGMKSVPAKIHMILDDDLIQKIVSSMNQLKTALSSYQTFLERFSTDPIDQSLPDDYTGKNNTSWSMEDVYKYIDQRIEIYRRNIAIQGSLLMTWETVREQNKNKELAKRYTEEELRKKSYNLDHEKKIFQEIKDKREELGNTTNSREITKLKEEIIFLLDRPFMKFHDEKFSPTGEKK